MVITYKVFHRSECTHTHARAHTHTHILVVKKVVLTD
jgi:hypothetical protein